MALSRIQTAEIADNAITTSKVADATVIGTDIVDGTIVDSMVASGAAIAHTKCAVGTVAGLDVGTGANQILQLDGSGNLPVLDGTQLTGIVSDFTPIENQLSRLGLHIGAVEQLAKFNMIDQVIDDYEDATGVTAYNGVAAVAAVGAYQDASASGHTVTAVGDAAISTTQKQFGTHGIAFDGTGDYLTISDHADFDYTGDFTIELWFWCNNTSGAGLITHHNAGVANVGLFLNRGAANAGKINWQCDVSPAWNVNLGSGLNDGAWHHLAWVRSGTAANNNTLYIDGTSAGTQSNTSTSLAVASDIGIGYYINDNSNYMNGYIDEVRVSHTARYTANFTPSTTAFTSDANTKLLIHGEAQAAVPAVASTGSSSSAELQGSAGAKYYEGQADTTAAVYGTDISPTGTGSWNGSNANFTFVGDDTVFMTTQGDRAIRLTETIVGDFYVEMKVNEAYAAGSGNRQHWGVYDIAYDGSFGATLQDGGMKYGTVNASWHYDNYHARPCYDSSELTTLGAGDRPGDTDVQKIERVSGVFKYYVNNVLKWTWTQQSTNDVRLVIGTGGGSNATQNNSAIKVFKNTQTLTTAAVPASTSMSLISTTTTAENTPTKASIVLQTEDELGTATINTDVKAGVSRDALNYVDTTLAKIGTWGSGNVYAANDVTMPGTVTKAVVVNNSKFSIDGGESTPTVSGGTITTDGSYTVHTFTSSGTFTTDNTQDMEYLVIAGGGGGGGGQTGSNYGGAGGGAGGMRFGTGITFTTGLQYAITVGAGGTAGSHVTNSGSEKNPDDAEDSSIIHSGTSFNITSSGGGGGSNRQRGAGGSGTADGYNDGHDGGSGGGGCGGPSENPEGGAGINDGGTFGTATFQGYDGAEGNAGGSGGGGGASATPTQPSGNPGGAGGAGRAHSITGSSVTYAGGGGGGSASGDSTTSSGGSGGGGNGGASNVHGAVGTDNTGGGGGGGGRSYAGASANGGAGGSGIVIIRRPTSIPGPTTQELTEGYTYKFDTSDSTLSGHTFKFATAADAAGSTEYTTGVTTSGTPGSAGAYTQIVVAASAPTLYYYCSNHASMGGTANTPTEAATTSMRYKVETKNQSASKVTRIHGTSLAWK